MTDFQDRGESARQAAGIDGTAGDAQDVSHGFVRDDETGACLLCGLAETYRKHGGDTADSDVADSEMTRCLCHLNWFACPVHPRTFEPEQVGSWWETPIDPPIPLTPELLGAETRTYAEGGEVPTAEEFRAFNAALAECRTPSAYQRGMQIARDGSDPDDAATLDAFRVALTRGERWPLDWLTDPMVEVLYAEIDMLRARHTPDVQQRQEAVIAQAAVALGWVRDILDFCYRADLREDLLWHVDGDTIGFAVNVSDVFWWGGADSEPVTPDTLPALKQAYHDLKAIGDEEFAPELFAARQRGMRPQGAAMPKGRAVRALFDACGPEREIDLHNPRKPPALDDTPEQP